MKKSADKLAIAYVIILSLIPVLALPNLIFQSHVLDAIPYDASALTTELGFFLSNLPAIIYIMVLYILGILNIWKSFSSYEEGDSTALINRMLIHKYGLVAFFLYDFILLFTLYFFAGAALTFMTGGLIIPLMLPIMSVMIFFTVIGFWLTILPGSFYALQVIRMTYKAGKISLGTAHPAWYPAALLPGRCLKRHVPCSRKMEARKEKLYRSRDCIYCMCNWNRCIGSSNH